MVDLCNLFSAWLLDIDGDGHVDDVNVGLVLTDGLADEAYSAVGLLAARLGLETAGLDLPICFTDSEPVKQKCRIIVGQGNACWPITLEPMTGGGRDYGLVRLVGKDLLVAGDDWQLTQCLLYLAVHYPNVGAQAGTLAGVVQELGRISGNELACHELHILSSGLRLVLERLDDQPIAPALFAGPVQAAGASLTVEAGRLQATMAMDWTRTPSGRPAPSNIECLSQLYSTAGIFSDWDADFLPDDLKGSLPTPSGALPERVAGINLSARVGLETLGLTLRLPEPDCSAFTVGSEEECPCLSLVEGRVSLQADPAVAAAIWTYLAEEYPKTPIGSSWEEIVLQLEGWVRQQPMRGEWQDVPLTWEVDELLQFWSELLPAVGGDLVAEVRVSEPALVREQLRDQLCQQARTAGHLGEIRVNVRAAYKQGLEWIREEIIPELVHITEPVERCLIRVAPFRPGDGALDPEARWLLELYPIDALLAKALGWETDRVEFELDDSLKSTYCLQVMSAGEVCYERRFTVWYSSLPYLSALGPRPTVHPPTGGVAWTSGHGQGFREIATDSERVFAAYQTTILPKLVATANAGGGLKEAQQPFFERLHLRVQISEPEERLGVREELLSPADALHEDLHFVGLDLFKRLGEQRNQNLRSPGLILPEVSVRPGLAPRLTYRLSPRGLVHNLSRPTLQCITFDQCGAVQGARLLWLTDSREMADLIVDAMERASAETGLPLTVQVKYPDGNRLLECRIASRVADPVDGAAGVIYQAECQARLEALAARPQAKTEVAGVSRQGRPIFATALTSPGGGHLISVAKMAGWKPTYLLNNRHHANEVSSSTAALDLLDQLTIEESGQQILRQINVVAIPLENADGAALHQQLAADNPNHKFHAARFNSLGREFADSYFQDDQRVPEARAFTSTWRKYVPDIVADNHGIPSHEWEQPFSGYLCPWFSSFWIPRSLFYAYFWYVDDPICPSLSTAKALERAITDGLRGQSTIHLRNQELLDSWRKYFLPFLPDHFAGEERSSLMWYYVPSGPDPTRRFASHRYPSLTVLDYTTEVADETAQGDYLSLCADTHRLAQLACLQWLALQSVELEFRNQPADDGSRYRCRRRKRPLSSATRQCCDLR